MYNVLIDEPALDQFVSLLPELSGNEKFYACLFARKKWVPEIPWIKSDKCQMRRFLTDKERLKGKIRQLHCEDGAFVSGNVIIPQEALGLYIQPNPRCMKKATWGLIKQCTKLLESNAQGYNIHQEAMSEVQRSCSNDNKPFIIFDLDWKDNARLQNCLDIVDGFCHVIETRGGYHILVLREHSSKIKTKQWYPELAKHSDNYGDIMTPVVGCYQGGFVPKLLRIYG